MSEGDSIPSCSIPCPWEGKNKCFKKLVAATLSRQAYLSQGQLIGLSQLYHPDPLPPCITAHGKVHFCPISKEEEVSPISDSEFGDSGRL